MSEIILPPINAPKYDFGFIAASFGMFSFGFAAINPSAIVSMEPTETGATLNMQGDIEFDLSHEQLAAIEAMIRARMAEMARQQQGPGVIIPEFRRKGQ